MSKHLTAEYDEDTGKVLLSIEDAYGNFVQVRMSPEAAVDKAAQLVHAAKVAKWRASGILGAFDGN